MNTTATTIRLSTADDILTAIPYLLGYHPTDSLVFICINEGQVSATGRIDLTSPPPPSALTQLLARQARDGVTAILLVGYGPATAVTTTVEVFRDACREQNIAVKEALRVTHGRYWSYLCPGGDCCPIDGEPTPAAESTVATQFVAAGHQALPDRQHLAGMLDPVDHINSGEIAAMISAVRPCGDTCQEALLLLRHYIHAQSLPDTEQTALILAALRRDPDLVADVLTAIDTNPPGACLEVLTWVTRLATPGYIAAPASLLAYAAWRTGNGAFANIACEHARTDDPDHDLAGAVHQLLTVGINPTTVPPLTGLSTETAAASPAA
ncbi:DUF4192 domain-containing protein [Phytomonospora endophytica]|uniref:DUF4192 domain-containing protein n=1 Tax=Phytomonospora endophytica TaxID=714109 RepID=A0A841G0N8_9ACTN|nr:DUF4192 domain-containing protein [Phytomonospora endophytica]MBB6037730.1 hypothetical protein [Phytomonospora endophytica]GIG67742.1 hypothetical protein Pen01_40370 [Phytomonospora endophytica]